MDDLEKREWLGVVYNFALHSEDPSTQNGAVVVHPRAGAIAYGFNDLPVGIEGKPERWQFPLKYKYIQHAERAALYQATKTISSPDLLEDCTLVCPFMACTECAKTIIGLGIRKCVTHKQAIDLRHWKDEIDVGLSMLTEAGVEIEWLDGDLGFVKVLRMAGKPFTP